MATLFTTVLESIEDNNKINDSQWADWDDAEHAISVYGVNFTGECDETERAETVRALNRIIRSNGVDYEPAVADWNRAVWGQDFAANGKSSPFAG